MDSFEVLDYNDDGVLSYREIRGATRQLGAQMNANELRAFFRVADKDRDRKITKEELAGALSSTFAGTNDGGL